MHYDEMSRKFVRTVVTSGKHNQQLALYEDFFGQADNFGENNRPLSSRRVKFITE